MFIVRNRGSNGNPQINTIFCVIYPDAATCVLSDNCVFILVHSITWLNLDM